MKKILEIGMSAVFGILVLFMIFMQQFDTQMLNFDIFNYYYVIAALICFGFLRVFWSLSTKQQNIILCVMPVIYLLTFDVLLIVLMGFMGLTAVNRYERTSFVKVSKVVYYFVIVYAMVNVALSPAIFYGFQEDQLRLYKQYPAEDSKYMVEILDYKTASNGPDSTYVIRFYEKNLPLTKHMLSEVDRSHIRDLEIKWLNSEQIEINDVIYSFSNDEITSQDVISNNEK
ncbi:MAG: hypothetical protein JXR88_09800 [Clostridia bacterium]|nr:hypothetical protein [Clostridia bacterium]